MITALAWFVAGGIAMMFLYCICVINPRAEMEEKIIRLQEENEALKKRSGMSEESLNEEAEQILNDNEAA